MNEIVRKDLVQQWVTDRGKRLATELNLSTNNDIICIDLLSGFCSSNGKNGMVLTCSPFVLIISDRLLVVEICISYEST